MVYHLPPRLDGVFHALASPTRRRMLTRLARGSATVGALAAPLRMSLPAASKHVRVLEAAGLLRRTVRGREHHCRLTAAPLHTAAEWLAHYRRFWDARLDALEALLIERGEATAPPTPGGPRAPRPRRRR
jgi:DNA-binding transcriptional ArsR family regulator